MVQRVRLVKDDCRQPGRTQSDWDGKEGARGPLKESFKEEKNQKMFQLHIHLECESMYPLLSVKEIQGLR